MVFMVISNSSVLPQLFSRKVIKHWHLCFKVHFDRNFILWNNIAEKQVHWLVFLLFIITGGVRFISIELPPHLFDCVVFAGEHLLQVLVSPCLAELLLKLLLSHVQLVLDLQKPDILSNLNKRQIGNLNSLSWQIFQKFDAQKRGRHWTLIQSIVTHNDSHWNTQIQSYLWRFLGHLCFVETKSVSSSFCDLSERFFSLASSSLTASIVWFSWR